MWPFSSSSSAPSSASSSDPSPWAGQTDTSFPASSASSSSSSSTNLPFPSPPAAGSANSSSSSGARMADTSSPTSYLSSSAATFSSPSSSSSAADNYTPSAAALLNNPAFNPAVLHPLAGLGKDDIEYLDIVDAQPNQLEGARTALPSRGWTDDLCYGTGTTYVSGLAIGGLVGAREGLLRPLGVQSPTFRLRLNAVLNQLTRRGSFFGNSAGAVALIYNIFDATIDNVRGKHDIYGSVASGGLSGALFKCTAGVRPMMISSAIMMGAAATWSSAKLALL